MKPNPALWILSLLVGVLLALPASSDPWDRSLGGAMFNCGTISPMRSQCTFDFTDSSAPDYNLRISSDCRPFIWLDPDISGTQDTARIDVARCASGDQAYANCTEVDAATTQTRYGALGTHLGINIDTAPSGVTARVFAQCEPTAQPITENIRYHNINTNDFTAGLTDDNLRLTCLSHLMVEASGNSTWNYECTDANEMQFNTFVRDTSTFRLRSATFTVVGAGMGASETCNVYFKSHPDNTADTSCDSVGAGAHNCEDADVVLIPLVHTGNQTCGGDCDPLNAVGEQRTVEPIGAVSTGKWSLAAGVMRYCSTGETDSGKICLQDSDCAGTCEIEDFVATSKQCLNLTGMNVELRYDIIDE